MIGLYTDIIVHYLAQDDPVPSAAASHLLDHELTPESPGYVSLVTLVEVVRAMTASFGADRQTVARVVEGLLGAPQLRVQAAETVWLALLDYRESQADFTDALAGRLARAAGCVHIATLDAGVAGYPGFRLLK